MEGGVTSSSLPPHRQRALAAIPSFPAARLHTGERHRAARDASQRIDDDAALRVQLSRVRQMLQLAAPAAIAHVMQARRLDAVRRRAQELLDPTAAEPAALLDRHEGEVPG